MKKTIYKILFVFLAVLLFWEVWFCNTGAKETEEITMGYPIVIVKEIDSSVEGWIATMTTRISKACFDTMNKKDKKYFFDFGALVVDSIKTKYPAGFNFDYRKVVYVAVDTIPKVDTFLMFNYIVEHSYDNYTEKETDSNIIFTREYIDFINNK